MEEIKVNEEIKQEKQTPFMKRVADMEKKIAELETKLKTVISSLRR